MSRLILLDTGPLGLVVHPEKQDPTQNECLRWLIQMLGAGHELGIPEICDYELRRELIRSSLTKTLAKLDSLIVDNFYLPITTEAMREAAVLWAKMRNAGTPTSHPHALDGDVILGAQANLQRAVGKDVIVATTNVGHLTLLTAAAEWQKI